MEQNQISSALNQKIVNRDYHQKWLKIGGIDLGFSVVIIISPFLISLVIYYFWNYYVKAEDTAGKFFRFLFLGGILLTIISLLFTIYHLIGWLIFRSQVKKLTS